LRASQSWFAANIFTTAFKNVYLIVSAFSCWRTERTEYGVRQLPFPDVPIKISRDRAWDIR